MLLKDKVIIVTGAGQGIGVAYAHKLSSEGANSSWRTSTWAA